MKVKVAHERNDINSCLNTFLFYFDFITFLLDQNNQKLHLYLCLSFLTAYIVFETQNKEENENPSDVWEKPVAKSFVEHMK